MIADFGVPPSYNGLFMAFAYISIALGSYLTPKLLSFFSNINKLSFILAILTTVSLWGMGNSSGYISFLLFTCSYWFLSGIQINIYSIAMSYISKPNKIGANFGLLANTTLVGAVMGSFMMGPILRELGTQYSFVVFAVVTVVFRLAMLLFDFDTVNSQHSHKVDFKINNKLWLLLITFNAGIMLSFIGRFNMSLIMKEQLYDIERISFVFAWGALIVFPLPYLFGRMSERISSILLLIVSLLSVVVALGILQLTETYTGFLTASFLICIMTYCSRGVTQKLMHDMYPLSEQKHAQSVLSSANWVAAILGFMTVSATSGIMSLQLLSILGCVIGLLAVIVLLFSPIGKV